MNSFEKILREHRNTITPADLAGFLYAVKLVQDEGGRGSVQIVLESSRIKDINTVIRPAGESLPEQEKAVFDASAFPPVEVMRRNWRRFELAQFQRLS